MTSSLETTGNNRLIEFAYNNLDNKGKLILIGVPHHTQNSYKYFRY